MKKLLVLAAVVVLLAGCDEIKDVMSKDFTLNGVEFNFSTNVSNGVAAVASGMTRAEATNSFTVTRSVDISELGSSELAEYANKISNVVVNSSLINVTINPPGNYTVSNLTVSAAGVTGSLVVPSYTIGGVFTPPSNIFTYTATLIMKLIDTKSVTVTVSGETDAPIGTTVNISYENDLIITAKLLN